MRKVQALTMLAALGCSGEGDVDRTQTNRVHKSVFQGTWYVGATVIEVPPTSATTFVGDQSEVEKLVWDIQEQYLIGYRAYEQVPGTDPRVTNANGEVGVDPGQGDSFADGRAILRENPLVVFPIEKHFDIRRDYNAATGEQTNLILENDTDRPWFEREWIRVNWSQNLLEQGGATQMSFTGASRAQVVFWHQQAEASEDAIRWIDETGHCVNFDGRKGGQWARDNCVDKDDASAVTYFDMVSEFEITPQMVDTTVPADGIAETPACTIPANYPATCGATRAKVRTAFMRVGQTEQVPIAEGSDQTMNVITTSPREYEPVIYDDRMMSKYGYFRVERQTYDRGYGTTEPGRIYLAKQHPIWKEVWAKDPDGNILRDDTGAAMTIPVADREPKPIVYHLSPHFRANLIPTIEDVSESWNNAFRQAVALAKGLIPGEYDSIDEVPEDVVPRMFEVNYNGWVCSGTWDHGSCPDGEISYDESRQVARLGDLRYHIIALVDALQITSPVGYGPSPGDPETGEILSAQAYVYGAEIDREAQYALDIVKWLNGDLTEAGIVSGDHVRDWVESHMNPIDPRNVPAALSQITIDQAGLERILGGRYPETQQLVEDVRNRGLAEALPQVPSDFFQQRFEKILGTEFESYLMTDEMRASIAGGLYGFEWTPGTPLPDEIKKLTDYSQWLSPRAYERDEARRALASKNCVWLSENMDNTVFGIATRLKDLYDGDDEGMLLALRHVLLRGVMEHEVGHTLGLRHNFAGSYDALNYFDRYWDLKKESFQNLGKIVPDSANFGEYYALNGQTPTQLAEGLREYQYSTVMDYGTAFGAPTAGYHGVGRYDMAAIAFGYGGAVEIFDESQLDAADMTTLKLIMRSRFSSRFAGATKCLMRFDDRRAPFFPLLGEEYHYSTIANMLGATPDDLSPLRARTWAKWADLEPQHDAAYQACLDYVNSDPEPDKDFNNFIDNRDGTYTEPVRPLEVPYAFCSDDHVDSRLSCHQWDEGADGLEMAQRGAANYEAYYFFRTYRNNRFPFAPTSYQGSVNSALRILPLIYQNWYTSTIPALLSTSTLPDFVQIMAQTMGMQLGFDTLTRVLTRPAYGKYRYYAGVQQFLRYDTDPDSPPVPDVELLIPRGVGRRYDAAFDFADHGYYYNQHIAEQAHYWDSQVALQMLTGAVARIAGVDTAAEGFIYLTPYENVFGEELYALFSGIWASAIRPSARRCRAASRIDRSPLTPTRSSTWATSIRVPASSGTPSTR
jgi:hypothetical protein